MKKFVLVLFAAAAISSPASAAPVSQATPEVSAEADALGECLTNKSTGEDRITLARWALAAMASAPKVADIAKVDPARKAELDKALAGIFTRLIARDCAAQSRPLFKSKSKAGFEAAFGKLGQIAFKELLADPKAEETLSDFTKYLNQSDFADVVK
ncbi:hypothetical protein AB5I39_13080 [Sphingomonas sp. MMS24-J45]|uniref:hypothetical protein n=1 Tax=Sphingomonas sp. MMS24-J45 TaxID=3238806 RepID=UPI0038515A67